MAKQLGRISGPLLQENLLRNGSNLEFSNDRTVPNSTVLFLDVNNNRIGINSRTPPLGKDLYVDGTVQTNNIISTSDATIADFDISNGQIQNFATSDINITSANSINLPALKTANIFINDNNIETYTANTDLTIEAFAGEKVIFETDTVIDNDLLINGTTFLQDLNATNILFNNITVNDNITVNRDVQFENIKISQNIISTTESNSNIDLSPAGTGTVEIYANTNVDGNVHATGNITFTANTILGDQDTDSIVINADVTSNIVPTSSGVYNLGSELQQWSEVKSLLLNGLDINSAAVAVGGVDIGDSQGNVFYVAVNGNNANRGDHQQGPWASLKYALEQADASIAGPVTIYLYPGEYEEELPMYVPPNVTVKGLDLRNCIIKPDSSSQSEDVFLLDGESTIEDLTIKDFYYDNVNDKGYAFRFAEVSSTKTVVTRRSPYIRNVTVITQGSVTSANDPRGFDAGDAGRGALIDGQYVDSSSNDASMLFHSCTFITPNAVAITMRNGVRVEWLNCFTYFADIGLYAINGALGRLTSDGSTVRKGAEIRSIGSASVYGNYGAIADGDETLMYLIGHNFAYIGTGKDVSNDTTLVIDENQTVERNNGRIYYTKTDERGNYDVGDSFFVDFDTGTTSLTGAGVDLVGLSSITIDTAGSQTFIDATKIETGNIRISGNTIQSLSGPIIWESASGEINVTGDIIASENIDITGNLSTQGLTTIGNQVTDTVEFDAEVTSSIIPNVPDTYNLGTSNKRWNYTWLSQIDTDQITINDNVIKTNDSNVNLELLANGSGSINPNNLHANNNFTVNNLTSLSNVDFFILSHTGNLTHTGNFSQTGNTNIIGDLNTSTVVDFENIKIQGNVITTTVSNADLELRANSTGDIFVPTANVEILNNASVNTLGQMQDVFVTNTTEFTTATISNNTQISNNTITTTESNSDLELRATGDVYIPSNNVEANNNLSVNSMSTFSDTNISNNFDIQGTYNIVGNISQSGKTVVTGDLNVGNTVNIEDIEINQNYISTTESNTDLEFRASGSGNIRFTDDTDITNNLQVNVSVTAANIDIATSLDLNQLITPSNIKIDDNFITTTVSNADLELRANGSGSIAMQDLYFRDNILRTLSSDIVLSTQTSNLDINSNKALILPVGTTAERTSQTGDIRFNTSFGIYEGFATSNVVFNGVYSDNFLTRVRVADTDNILRFDIAGVEQATITDSTNLSALQVDDININSNQIVTNVSNSNVDLSANGTGNLVLDDITIKGNTFTNTQSGGTILATSGFGSVVIAGTEAVELTAGDTASRRSNPEVGEFRYNTDDGIAEVYTGTEWVAATGPVGETVSAETMGYIIDEWSLILG